MEVPLPMFLEVVPVVTAPHLRSQCAYHAVAADHGHHSRHHQQPDQQTAQHDCIGCIAAYSAIGVVPAAPVPASGIGVPGMANALPDTTAGPDTPPPKP